ncbi:uncharacterized protein LOC125225549 [Leguminivora glycinivorella]|uniref:uncharacterized protein LOC125225549 n=1 Tax=Leguminivora glycinivorella TaxID=1035111 RepID=UPI00200F8DC9|nr:uncharacterized protein LOC125225549 [Leguminivora glycinivorella]
MSAARDGGDSTPGSDVTRLFPKCRPRMHRHDRLNSGLEGREHSINNVSSDEERESQLVILNSKGSAYKLRDSRIIEIAGGRELYSQSRTKAVRKLRHSNTHKHNLRNKVRSLGKDSLDYSDNLSNEISLHRLNNEPKKMISRHTSPTYTNGDREPIIEETMGIPKNSSPILDPHKTNDVSAKSSPIAVVADGEVVVFDDNEDWKVILNSVSLGLRMDPDASDHDIDLSVKRTLDNMKNGDSDMMNNKSELSESESSPGEERSDASPSGVWMSGDEDKGRVTRVIGELPIAEYEGSPRRYGIGSQKQAVRSPRPGFPQRIVTESRDVTPPSGSAAFDYLYEFSETRKVLEEFFRCPAVAGHAQLNSNDEIVNFQELDYELRRQTQDCPSENGVEGSDAEWPHTDTLDSPHTAHNHTNFLGLQVQPYTPYTTTRMLRRANVAALRVGSAWSGSASPAAPPPRARAPLALSPETSDEGSDLSLIIMENELSEMKVQMDTSRVVVTHLPIVEDGLSSGHASDNDNNNQLPTLQQTHSSVIIEEIVENGTSAEAHVLSDADLHSLDPLACSEVSPPPPAPAPHRPAEEPEHAQHTAHAPHAPHTPHVPHDDYPNSRKRPSSAQSTDSVEIKPASGDEDEADTDLETDRLLGQQRTDDQGFFDDKDDKTTAQVRKRSDEKAKSKICLSVDRSCFVHLMSAETAKEAWDALERAYDDKGLGSRVRTLQNLCAVKLENFNSMEAYVNEILSLAQQLANMKKQVDDEFLGALMLKGLPAEYEPMIMALEHSGVTITADLVKTKLLQDQRWTTRGDSSECLSSMRKGATASDSWTRKAQQHKDESKTKESPGRKREPWCWKCKQKGHLKKNCRSDVGCLGYCDLSAYSTRTVSGSSWYVDSGATNHMTSKRDLMTDFRSQSGYITIANGDKLQCTGASGKRSVEIFFPASGDTTVEVCHTEDQPVVELEAEMPLLPKVDPQVEAEKPTEPEVWIEADVQMPSSSTDTSGALQEPDGDGPAYNLRSRIPRCTVASALVVEASEPTTVKEALHSSDSKLWRQAMQDEIDSFNKHDAWELVDRPAGKNIVKNRWLFKIKRDANGKIACYRARLVAKGFTQKFGIDYMDTYSPVVRHSSLRMLLSLAVELDLKIDHLDVKTAFLNGDLSEEIYMAQPEGFVQKGNEHKVYKLKKAVYGLKQASRAWYEKVKEVLVAEQFTQSKYESCIFSRRVDTFTFLILAMTDDEKEPCLESGQCAPDRKEVYSDNENNNVVKSVAEKEPCLVPKDMDQCETECKENSEVIYRECESDNSEIAKVSESLENKQSGQLENIECSDKDLKETCSVNEEISDSNCDEISVSKNDTESNEEIIQDTKNCDAKKGWRKPKSRTVMPAGSVSGGARSPPHDDQDETLHNGKDKDGKKKSKNKEDMRSVLIEGVLFRARYLGSTQLACEGQPTKATRMLQAEEAVSRIKALAPEGENQPSTEVDLFISTEKIMVLNTELKEIMMDHALRTISYIADIGDLVVLMARRRFVPHETDSDQPKLNRTPKMICHVFESEEAQFIAQSIGQAFQVAYMEFLKANGIEDHSFVKEMDYQEVLNSQEIFGDELQMFAKKELQKEVVVPKTKGEILGVVVVESGWGSMLPTVVIANLAPAGAAARCGHLNIGDQIIAINGVSLVGLPLSTCQTYIKNSKNQTVVKLTVVPCAPVVEVKIKRPDTKYQLGFSVQNGVICSLLRGGIAERGGVRVGHRIIEINSQSVVAVPHERIVNLLATSVGEILMKTMPTSMFRLLTGQENPVFI